MKMFKSLSMRHPSASSESGFTLIELLIVILFIGILAAIAAPNWIAFTRQQRVNRQQQALVSILETAQRRAKLNKMPYSVSFKTLGQIPQYALHPDKVPVWQLSDSVDWRSLKVNPEEARVTPTGPGQVLMYTNLASNTTVSPTRNNITTGGTVTYGSNVPVTITFSETGALRQDAFPAPNLGNTGLMIALAVPQSRSYTTPASGTRRCVIIRTLNGLVQSESGNRCPYVAP